jgi:hypothetical protein
MTHDEAIRVLNSTRWMLLGKERDALDYAIAYMEPKPTQFDERISDVCVLLQKNPLPISVVDLIRDMQAHIQKLEKGQSDENS